MIEKMDENKDIKSRYKAGISIVKLPPVFSINGQYILSACNDIIYCYNTKSGKNYLKYEGHNRPIIGFGVCILEKCECVVACFKDGLVLIWKLQTAVEFKKIKLKKPNITKFQIIRNDVNTSGKAQSIVCWQENGLKIGILNLDQGKLQDLNIPLRLSSNDFKLAVGGYGKNKHIALINENNLYFVKLNNKNEVHRAGIKAINKFTCVACSYESDCVLTGDSSGRVIAWNNLQKNATEAVYHWHTLAVKSICFSSSGSSFYSGGSECVLVKWNLENPLQKDFLPRLPWHLEHIVFSDDNSLVALSTADNAIHVLDRQDNLVSTIQHLVWAEKYPVGILFDPRTRCLVLNGIVGHLQFFSPHDQQLLYNLDIVDANRITDERDSTMKNIDVTKVCLSRTGIWMATVEERHDTYQGYPTFECRLKFWLFNSKRQMFELNTFITYPHKRTIHDIKFQPALNDVALRCVTLGDEKYYKVWQLEQKSSDNPNEFTWTCSAAVSYKEYIPKCAAFSNDGSLLAISFKHILTVWLPDSCELKCTLLHPIYLDEIIGVGFGAGQECHLLVSACKSRLCVWNLLTLSMLWTVPIKISRFVSELSCSFMAVFSSKNTLYIFNPACPKPLYKHHVPVKVLTAAIVPNLNMTYENDWYQKSKLYFINANKQLHCLEGDEEVIESIQFIQEKTDDNSIFSQLAPGIQTAALEHYKPVVHSFTKSTRRKKLNDLLDTPVHTMAPLRLSCYSILSTMVFESIKEGQIKTKSEEDNEDEHKMETDQNVVENGIIEEENLDKINAEKIDFVLSAFEQVEI